MKTSLLPSLVVSLALLTSPLLVSPASALTDVQTVTADSTEEMGVTVKVKKAKDGTFDFTVTRYIHVGEINELDRELIVEGTADLEVRNAGGLLCKTQVAAKTQAGKPAATKDGNPRDTVTYWFSLSRECIPFSRFTLLEDAHYKDDVLPRRAGRSMYQFDLPGIAKGPLTLPAHP